MMLQRYSLVSVLLAIAAILIVLPLAFVLHDSIFDVDTGAVSFAAYLEIITEPRLRRVLFDTIIFSIGSTVLALIIGLPLAFFTARTDLPFRKTLSMSIIAPFLIPPFMMVIGWISLTAPSVGFVNLALRAILGLDTEQGPINIYSMGGMIWLLGLYLVPYVFLLAQAGFAGMDSALEDAARISGAGWLTTISHITLPVLAPILLATVLLSLMLSVGDFIIPATIGRRADIAVLTTAIWQETAFYPTRIDLAAAHSALLVAIALACLAWRRRLLRGRTFASLGGKGFRAQVIPLGRWRWFAAACAIVYVACAAILPLLAIFFLSLMGFWTTDVASWRLTLGNYEDVILRNPTVWLSVKNSLLLAMGGAVAAVALAVMMSWALHRTEAPGRRLLGYLTVIPMGVPGVVLGVGILNAWLALPIPIYGTIWILFVAYMANYLPIAVQSADGALTQVSSTLEDASRMSGVGAARTIWYITLPLMRPALIGAWILVYTLMLRDISASILLYAPSTIVLSVGLYNIFEVGLYTQLAAYSVVMFVIGLIPVIVLRTWSSGDQKVMA